MRPSNPYFYSGQYLDQVTGLYNLRARRYDAAAGRFLSRDVYPYQFGNPIELNRYGYVAGNAINAFDPSGMFLESIIAYAKHVIRTNGVTHYAGRAMVRGAISGLVGFGFGILVYSMVEAVRNDSSVQTEFSKYFNRSGLLELVLNTILGAGIGVKNELVGSNIRIAFKGLQNSQWMLVRARSAIAVYAMQMKALAMVSYWAGKLTFLGGELMLLVNPEERESLRQFMEGTMRNLIISIAAGVINGTLFTLVESGIFFKSPKIGIINGEVLATTFANTLLTAVSKSA